MVRVRYFAPPAGQTTFNGTPSYIYIYVYIYIYIYIERETEKEREREREREGERPRAYEHDDVGWRADLCSVPF